MHMIGDVKKQVFAAIMSSDDYLHAYQQLMQLNLKKVQTREIIRVVLQCCLAEKKYNPFYGCVLSKLCSDPNYRYTLKYALWDHLKDLDRLEVRQVLHLA